MKAKVASCAGTETVRLGLSPHGLRDSTREWAVPLGYAMVEVEAHLEEDRFLLHLAHPSGAAGSSDRPRDVMGPCPVPLLSQPPPGPHLHPPHPPHPLHPPPDHRLVPRIHMSDITRSNAPLGQGGFGEVWHGTYQGAPVALKTINPDSLSPDQNADFEREAGIHAWLRHPNVVVLYGHVLASNPPYMVLELMQRSLGDLLRSPGAMSAALRIQLVRNISCGLQHLHSHGILHCDLKPTNVLLRQEVGGAWVAKLSDFGLSTVGGQGEQGGTLPYMAPELFDDPPVYSQASDIYALGMTTWEVCSREVPFHKINRHDQLTLVPHYARTGQRHAFPADAPPCLKNVTEGCWQVAPAERPTLGAVLAALDADVPPPPPQPPAPAVVAPIPVRSWRPGRKL
jgi:hypothetical protein